MKYGLCFANNNNHNDNDDNSLIVGEAWLVKK